MDSTQNDFWSTRLVGYSKQMNEIYNEDEAASHLREGKISNICAAIKMLRKILWPKDKKSIWEVIETQVSDLIDVKLLKYDLEQKKASLDSIRQAIEHYVDHQDYKDKRIQLSLAIHDCESLFSSFSEDKERDIQLIPLSVTLSIMHLALLRELYEYGSALFESEQDPSWKDDLVTAYKKYINYFQGDKSVVVRWEEWRKSFLKTKSWPEATSSVGFIQCSDTYHQGIYKYGRLYVGDNVTRDSIERTSDITSSETRDFTINCIKSRLFSESLLKMASQIHPTFMLSRYIPEMDDIPSGPNSYCVDPHLETIEVGFLNSDTIDGPAWRNGFISSSALSDLEDSVYLDDQISEIVVSEYNAVDSLQFVYQDGHKGQRIGGDGGEKSKVNATEENLFTGMRVRFGGAVDRKTKDLVSIALCRMDGKWTKEYGNRGNWFSKHHDVLPDTPSYALAGGQFSVKTSDDQRGMIRGLYLVFNYIKSE